MSETKKPTLDSMGNNERSLLLFVESCAVDFWGRMDQRRINDEDREILDQWNDTGFVVYGRIAAADCNKDGALWVRLSEAALDLAHQERRARIARTWKKRGWQTTHEARDEETPEPK